MSTVPPVTDNSQAPITAADPRVAQILAMIKAKATQSQVDPVAAQSTAMVATPIQQSVQQQQNVQQLQPPTNPNLPPMQGDSPQLAPSAPPQITQAPGPIKSFLQSLVSGLGNTAYAGTQGALERLGLPTDYEKQQNAAKLALQQQAQNSLEGYRTAEGNRQDALTAATNSGLADYTIPKDAMYGSLAGTTLPRGVAVPLMQKMAALSNAKDIATGKNTTAIQGKEIQYGPDSYLRHGVRSVGGRIEMYDKATGDKLNDMGPDTALITGPRNADARAAAQAKYGLVSTIDENGAPTTISRLQALQSGAPNVNFTNAKGVISDMVGVKQYQSILDNQISPNISVLNDPSQRAVIAHTLAEGKDASPGAIQALITSGLQEGALTPQGAALAAGILQAREFGSVARKYGGNMNGTEGLMNRIVANQASPLNAEQLNRDLIQNDRAFTDKALGSITNLMSNSKGTKAKGGATIAPTMPSRPAGVPANAQWNAQGNGGKGSWVVQ